jgi:hypothetical protein
MESYRVSAGQGSYEILPLISLPENETATEYFSDQFLFGLKNGEELTRLFAENPSFFSLEDLPVKERTRERAHKRIMAIITSCTDNKQEDVIVNIIRGLYMEDIPPKMQREILGMAANRRFVKILEILINEKGFNPNYYDSSKREGKVRTGKSAFVVAAEQQCYVSKDRSEVGSVQMMLLSRKVNGFHDYELGRFVAGLVDMEILPPKDLADNDSEFPLAAPEDSRMMAPGPCRVFGGAQINGDELRRLEIVSQLAVIHPSLMECSAFTNELLENYLRKSVNILSKKFSEVIFTAFKCEISEVRFMEESDEAIEIMRKLIANEDEMVQLKNFIERSFISDLLSEASASIVGNASPMAFTRATLSHDMLGLDRVTLIFINVVNGLHPLVSKIIKEKHGTRECVESILHVGKDRDVEYAMNAMEIFPQVLPKLARLTVEARDGAAFYQRVKLSREREFSGPSTVSEAGVNLVFDCPSPSVRKNRTQSELIRQEGGRVAGSRCNLCAIL